MSHKKAALFILIALAFCSTLVLAADTGSQPNTSCIAQGQACVSYATGSANIDLCCDGGYCSNSVCAAKENPGFFVRIWRAFIGGQPSTTTPPDCTATSNVCYSADGKVLCDATLKECVAKYGQCRCGNPESNAPPKSDLCPNGLLTCKTPTGAEIRCQGVPEQQSCLEKYGKEACFCKRVIGPAETTTTQTVPTEASTTPAVTATTNVCDPCNTVICSYPQGGQFVCPTSLRECAAKFGSSCTVIGCFNGLCQEKINQCKDPSSGAAVQCEGTLADCNQRYQNSCTCGVPPSNSSCPQTVHLCYVSVPGVSPTSAVAPSDAANALQAVKCEGRYEDCQQRYGHCQCGIPQPPTCQEKVHICYPYSGDVDVTTVVAGSATGIDATQTPSTAAQTTAGGASPTTAALPVSTPIRCEGSYDECVARYGRCTCGAPDKYCVYANARYKMGEQFTASDGCNACTCRADGMVVCTLRACPPITTCDAAVQTCKTTPATMDKSTPILVKCEGTLKDCQAKYGTCTCGWVETDQFCVYNGQMRKTGEQFTASDGCNACTCQADGTIVCTQRACPPTDQCHEPINRCYLVTATTANAASVKCSDTYANCVAKYRKCDCGYETPPSPSVGCMYNNRIYKEGESFPANDGCNKCSCSNGAVRCTLMACRIDDCASTSNLCTTPNEVVVCNDTYTACVQRYGGCQCGGTPVVTRPVNIGILT